MEHILSPGPNGSVEILQISNGTKEVVGNEELNGCGEVIDLSGNGYDRKKPFLWKKEKLIKFFLYSSWLVTGSYAGVFQIFHIVME
jgi:hypothetical protein